MNEIKFLSNIFIDKLLQEHDQYIIGRHGYNDSLYVCRVDSSQFLVPALSFLVAAVDSCNPFLKVAHIIFIVGSCHLFS